MAERLSRWAIPTLSATLELTAAKRVRGEVVKRKRMSRVVVGGDPQLIVRGGRQAGHAENSLRRLNAV